jgi:hypothetical protein
MRSETIEATGADGIRLRIEFIWLGDRFRHVISAVHPSGEIQPLLESIEGSAANNWPPSPPLQSLSIETLADGRRVALLVGMAGGSHWSASIEPTFGSAEFLFDLACRHTKQPTHLGSNYQRLSKSSDVPLIISEEELVTTPVSIAIKPHSTPDRGTTRWKFTVRLSPDS